MEYIDNFPGFRIMVSHISDGDFGNTDTFPEIIRPVKQIHSTEVHILDENTIGESFSEKDGIYTKLSRYAIGALCADCPIVVAIGDNECAVVHSGWRGTKAHISLAGLSHFHTKKDDIKIYIGPHISSASYEVQEDFLTNFPGEYFHENNKKIFFDIEKYIIDDLIGYGIRRENIWSHGTDTFSDTDFHSYRRDSTRARSIVAVERI